jgi:hypothetical protein
VAIWPTARIRGQESFLLKSNTVDLAVTQMGGMLGPVTFFPQDPCPIEPYAIAPWAEETLPPGTPSMLETLRGDWFCSAFGENLEVYEGAGRRLPPHGETANGRWSPLAGAETSRGSWLKLGMDLSLQGGRCVSTTALLADQSVVYQLHELSSLSAPCNPGHHATLAFPDSLGAGYLSFSPFMHARTYFEATERPENGGYSLLRPDVEFANLRAVPCIDGTMTDLTRYPARRGFEDIAILCADPDLEFAWSSVTFAEKGYVWFSIRDPEQLSCTLLWFSNGGRHSPPWSGRHVNVMGIEDVTAFFHVGVAASCRANSLSMSGIRTHLLPDAGGRLSIPYIQGVSRIPAGFDRVANIEPQPQQDRIRLIAESGVTAELCCNIDFLHTHHLGFQDW